MHCKDTHGEQLQSKGDGGCGFAASILPQGAMGASQAAEGDGAGLGKRHPGMSQTGAIGPGERAKGFHEIPQGRSAPGCERGSIPRSQSCWSSSTAREERPSDLSPAEGLQLHSWRNKQQGTLETQKFLDTEHGDGLGWTLHPRPGLIQLHGFALTHRGKQQSRLQVSPGMCGWLCPPSTSQS